MHARMTITKSNTPGEEATAYVRDNVVPEARALDGFAGIIDLTDPETGDGFTITLWATEDALRASEEAADELRGTATKALGAEIVGVRRLQVETIEIPS